MVGTCRMGYRLAFGSKIQ
ncbi:hypothetical protein V3C99_007796, partial [Haemonchus contortus]